MSTWSRVFVAAGMVATSMVGAVGCTGGTDAVTGGSLGEPSGAGGQPSVGTLPIEAELRPSPVQWKRLTAAQFRNSLIALLGAVDGMEIEEDPLFSMSTVEAGRVSTSSRGVALYRTAIEDATTRAFTSPERRDVLLGCIPSGPTDVACLTAFVRRFGRSAWRRPLVASEEQRYVDLALEAAESLGDAYAGARYAAAGLLNSPFFLYRAEFGAPSAEADLLEYTPYDMASRLAFFVTNTTPDETLLDAAASGVLASKLGLAEQAQRLLASEAGLESVTGFADELFHTRALHTKAKDAGLFPQYDAALVDAMFTDLHGLWAMALRGELTGLDLFTTRKAYVNSALGNLYGFDTSSLAPGAFATLELPADSKRVGILGRAALHSLFSSQQEGSPTLRGRFIREVILCQKVPPPPPGVDATVPEPPAGVVMTKREQLDLHRTDPTCAGCHALMDPLGYALEHFDAIGAYRETDQGKPIDASGDLDGEPFQDLPGLAVLLAQSEKASACMVRNLYTYATGSEDLTGQEAQLAKLTEKFSASGAQLSQLVADIVSSDGFRFATPAE